MLIVGNWKTNFDKNIKITSINSNHNYVICPPFPFLDKINNLIKGYKNIFLGAQNINTSLCTGDISGEILSYFGCRYVIVGHSERNNREDYIEQINILNKYKIIPILCISSIDEKNLTSIDRNIIIAYEPKSAIGIGGKIASIEDIYSNVEKIINIGFNNVLYGGSVDENSKLPSNISGILLGRKSIPVDNFLQFSL